MKTLRIIILLGCTFCLSCTEILDVQPLDAVSDVAVWKDPALMELFVNSRYEELPHGYVLWAGGLRLTTLTDESYQIHQGSRLTNKYTQGEITPINMHLFGGFWFQAYAAIRNLNIFLENVNPEIGDSTRTTQLTAEVKYLRAWFYTELFSRYGEVPLLENTILLANADQVIARSSVEDIVDFVDQELKEAAEFLPTTHIDGDFGRATRGAALALRARALLYGASPLFGPTDPEKWQKVAEACEALFDLNVYSLSSDYNGLFLNVSDPEIIFAKQFIGRVGPGQSFLEGYYVPTGGHNIEEWRLPNGSGGWASDNPLMNLVDQYETLSGEIPVLAYTGAEDNLVPILNPNATAFDASNPYLNRDPRLDFSILHDGAMINNREVEFWECGMDSRCEDVESWWNGALIDHTIRKGLDLNWTPENELAATTPWVYMRLAEFYLTYAEAQYHLGNLGLAAEYVDRVRSRPGVNMPAIQSSQLGSDMLEKIKHERMVELAFEGNRWYDARRWLDAEIDFAKDAIGLEVIKDADSGEKLYRYFTQQKRSFPVSHNLFPIPIEEINKTDWVQNPGY